MPARKIIRRDCSRQHTLPDYVHPVLRRIYSARNITSTAELDTSINGMLPYRELLGIEQAVQLLSAAIKDGKRILVVADYDADGATGCAVAMRGLRAMGAADLHYLVPSRFDFGYGLSPELAEVAAGLKPDLLLTVDNGISSIEGVRLARARGMDVLITDHHLARDSLPEANVIVNPNQPGDPFPSKNLAGVGVVFYILAALRAYLREADWFAETGIREPNLASLLDLVALGTVADVVPLDFNNRVLVAQGLARIRAGRGVPGINSLLEVAKRKPAGITASDLGFAVGPRLNAAGRLEDMSLGIECLLCDDAGRALAMARKLDELNRERRGIQQEMQEFAEAEMSVLATDGDLPFGVCLYKDDWHQGVVGILASKVKDKWNRPVIAFADDRDGLIKGSARSVKAVHIRDLLDSIARREPDLIIRFGGHAMAAGLTIRRDDFDRFSTEFDVEVRRHLHDDDLAGSVLTDGDLCNEDINMSLAEAIDNAGPWGHEFPEPLFDGVFEVAERRIVAEKHLKLLLRLPDSDQTLEAMAFFTDDQDWPSSVRQVQAVYRLNINEYYGNSKLQLIVEHLEPVPAET